MQRKNWAAIYTHLEDYRKAYTLFEKNASSETPAIEVLPYGYLFSAMQLGYFEQAVRIAEQELERQAEEVGRVGFLERFANNEFTKFTQANTRVIQLMIVDRMGDEQRVASYVKKLNDLSKDDDIKYWLSSLKDSSKDMSQYSEGFYKIYGLGIFNILKKHFPTSDL